MAQRRFIVLGDKTSHGGTVISAQGAGLVPFSIDGKPVACVGDRVACPRCKGVHYIITGANDPPMKLDGHLVATESCRVSDGSFLMSIPKFRTTHETGGSAAVPVAQGIHATAGITAGEASMLSNAQQAPAREPDEEHSIGQTCCT
ncbi:MAG: PAAR domain-containing protein [Azoarcus sp.]|jgi:uncharacterized Zn-binding protein involved in type VI secretion|nr:PAAR domain-containing protein [Azoarcus sp.]